MAFYENVDLDTLVDDIGALEIAGYSPKPLHDFLNGFQRSRDAWGLPQGAEASGLLANLYLLPVDEYLARNKIDYLRFSDDIDIFGTDWSELRSILLEINHIMRSRRLSMSASKTEIYAKGDATQVVENSEKDALNYLVKTKKKAAAQTIRNYFDKVINRDKLSARDLKFALYRLKIIEDSYAVGWCLENVDQNPHLASDIFDYLFSFKAITGSIGRHLVTIAKKSDLVANPTLHREIISFFLCRGLVDTHVRDLAWAAVEDKNRNGLLREFASRYVGRDAGQGDGQRLVQHYHGESDTFIRRALLVAAYEARYIPRKLLESLRQERTDVRWTAAYLLNEPAIPLPKIRD